MRLDLNQPLLFTLLSKLPIFKLPRYLLILFSSVQVVLFSHSKDSFSLWGDNSTPSFLLKVAGSFVVELIVKEIVRISEEEIETIYFLDSTYNKETERILSWIISRYDIPFLYSYKVGASIIELLKILDNKIQGKTLLANANSFVKSAHVLKKSEEAIVWVSNVEPEKNRQIVKVNESGLITDFVYSGNQYASDVAMIEMCYFKDVGNLLSTVQELDREKNLAEILQSLKENSFPFIPFYADQCFECISDEDFFKMQEYLINQYEVSETLPSSAEIRDSVIIGPVFLEGGCRIENSVIGPFVSVHRESHISHSVIRRSILGENLTMSNVSIENSIFGNSVQFIGRPIKSKLGSHAKFEF